LSPEFESDVSALWAIQGKVYDDDIRRRIDDRVSEIAKQFFEPAEPRPSIPEPIGTTDLYHLRRMQGWVEPGSNPWVFMIVAALVIALIAGFLLVFL
jgi:hypothetical protein